MGQVCEPAEGRGEGRNVQLEVKGKAEPVLMAAVQIKLFQWAPLMNTVN